MIKLAVDILKRGGLVAFPTETVYGLGADASNQAALSKIFTAKGRPADHPLIVHISSIEQLSLWARDIPDAVWGLARVVWPGPVTMILKKAPGVLDEITGYQDTIGIRIPNHPVALALLTAFGGGLAAPSANRFGRISPTSVRAVREELGDAVDLILDGGACAVGVESTIIDLSQATPTLLRPGMISRDQLAAILGVPVLTPDVNQSSVPRVSGSLLSHYAPSTPTCLVAPHLMNEFIEKNKAASFAVVTYFPLPGLSEKQCVNLSDDPIRYAHDLYQTLRDLDKSGVQQIVIVAVPETVAWDAIRDRLQRASA